MFVKEVGDGESKWHQDQAACPLNTDKFLTIWLPLVHIYDKSILYFIYILFIYLRGRLFIMHIISVLFFFIHLLLILM